MRPALDVVVSRLRAGLTPGPLEVGAMLHEAGADRTESGDLVRRYAAALLPADSSPAEQTVVLLQSFRLDAGSDPPV